MNENKGKSPIEAAREHRSAFLAEWEIAVNPHTERAIEASKGALSLVRLGLRSLMILNGGALVLTPAYIGLFKISLETPNTLLVVVSASMFVFGLILSWACMLLGFFSMAAVEDRSVKQAEVASAKLFRAFYHNDRSDSRHGEISNEIVTAQEAVDKLQKKFLRLRLAGIVLSCVTIALFVCGSILSGCFIIQNAKTLLAG